MEPSEAAALAAGIRSRVLSRKTETITASQRPHIKDRLATGPVWVSRVKLAPPTEPDVNEAIRRTIDILGDGKGIYDYPTYATVPAEWVGLRKNVDKTAPEPDISIREKYDNLVKDTDNDLIMLYVHGGAHYIGSPATSRAVTSRLAQLSGGRCLVIDYRLAPQNAFPAPLVDIFVAYLSLLYPPPGSLHSAVPSSKIVLVGDSIGGATCLSFLQTLLTLNRVKHPSLRFQGKSVPSPIPLPAALAGTSINGDVTLSLPDWTRNAPFDIFVTKFGGKRMAALEPEFPPCEAWPTKPPRGYIFCDVSMIYHPLVSVTVTRDWTGAPPLYLASGQEQLRDTVQIVAQKAVSQGVKVVWESYEGMVHTWFALFPKLPHSEKLFKTWADFCRRAVAGESFEAVATELDVRTLKPTPIDINTMTDVSVDNALERMIAKSKIMEVYTGKGAAKSNL